MSLIKKFRSWYFFKYKIHHQSKWDLNGIVIYLDSLSPKMRDVVVRNQYENNEFIITKRYCEPSDVVLEFGGAIGYISAHLKKNLGLKKVTSFEPDPFCIEEMERNHALNGLNAPNVIPCAVSGTTGSISLRRGSNFWENSIFSSGNESRRSAESSDLVVQTVAYEELLETYGSDANVIICDIEGAELLINWEMTPKQIEKIIIELHPEIYGYTKMYEFVHSLIGLGYLVEDQSRWVLYFKRSK